MGKLSAGILGQVTNKVGNVVGSTWKGINTVRIHQPNVANPKTAGQVTARGKLSYTAKFGSEILSFLIQPLWNRFAKMESGYNAWFKANIDAFTSNGTIDPTKIVISSGKLQAPISIGDGVSGNLLTMTYDPAQEDPNALPTDEVYCLALDASEKIVCAGMMTGNRAAGSATIVTNGLVPTRHYIAFRRVDGTMVSMTGYDI
jgi:hypothetical protein